MNEFEDYLKSKNPENNEEVQRKRKRELDDLRWILSDIRGRRVLWRILTLCNTFRNVFYANELMDARENGRRSVGDSIRFDIIEAEGYGMLDIMDREDKVLKEREGGE